MGSTKKLLNAPKRLQAQFARQFEQGILQYLFQRQAVRIGDTCVEKDHRGLQLQSDLHGCDLPQKNSAPSYANS